MVALTLTGDVASVLVFRTNANYRVVRCGYVVQNESAL